MTYTIGNKTFKSGKPYYQITWFDGKVVIIKMYLEKFSLDDYDYEIGFKEVKNLIPTTLHLGVVNPKFDWTEEDQKRIDDFILDLDIPRDREKMIKSIFMTAEEFKKLQGE